MNLRARSLLGQASFSASVAFIARAPLLHGLCAWRLMPLIRRLLVTELRADAGKIPAGSAAARATE
jgi:hypothetical protein